MTFDPKEARALIGRLRGGAIGWTGQDHAADALTAALDENERLLALMRRAHTLMRECGWQLAPASDLASGDGVLEAAVAEVEDEFRSALERKEGP